MSFDASDTRLAAKPVDGSAWVRDTENAIARILERRNPIGRIVLDAVTADIIIQFDSTIPTSQTKPSGSHGQMTILISAREYPGDQRPGARYDEIVFHEFAHALDRCSAYVDLTTNDLKFDNKDFFSITVTNTYASVSSRPLRKDHHGFTQMPQMYLSPKGEVRFNADYKSNNLDTARSRIGESIYGKLAMANAPWNPFG